MNDHNDWHEEAMHQRERVRQLLTEQDQLLERNNELRQRAEKAEARVAELGALLFEVREAVSNHGLDLDGMTPEDVCEHVLLMVHGFEESKEDDGEV